jgi:hypothetical protein
LFVDIIAGAARQFKGCAAAGHTAVASPVCDAVQPAIVERQTSFGTTSIFIAVLPKIVQNGLLPLAVRLLQDVHHSAAEIVAAISTR